MIKEQDIEIIRGDDVTVTLYLLGDYTSKTAYFTVKEKDDLTGVRYIDLSTSSGIAATYDDTRTKFIMTIPKANTSGLTFNWMVYDLTFDEDTTKITGKVKLIHEYRSPTDNLPIPEDDLRYVLVDTSEYSENDFIYFNGSGLVNISATEAKQLLCEKGSYIIGVVDIFNLEGV